jgi:integrase
MAGKRRRFGKIRKLPSGRYQASFIGPSGTRQTASQTFRTKTDADRWLAAVESDLSRGTWLDEGLGRETFGRYARAWLRDHPKMGPRYRETCERNLRLHLAPLEDVPLRALTPPVVRQWYASVMRGKGGRTSIQQSYRFLHAVLATAVGDGAIPANPANIPGAGTDRAKERPVASVAQVAALIEAITPRYRAAVLLGAWCGLRRGEIIALTPQDIDLDAGTVAVRTNRVELLETRRAFDAPPKTDAGKRTVTVPPHVLPILAAHVREWSGTDRVFIGRDGEPMRGDAVRQAFARARRKATCPVSGSTIYAIPVRPSPPPLARRSRT